MTLALIARIAILVAIAPLSSFYYTLFSKPSYFDIISFEDFSTTLNKELNTVKSAKITQTNHEMIDDTETVTTSVTNINHRFNGKGYQNIINDAEDLFYINIEEVIHTLARGKFHPSTLPPHFIQELLGEGGAKIPMRALLRIHHWGLVILWCGSFFIAFLVPLYHVICYHRRGNRRQSRLRSFIEDFTLGTRYKKKRDSQEKIKSLKRALQKSCMKLEKNHLLKSNSNNNFSKKEDVSPILLMPIRGEINGYRQCDSTCPICLTQFEVEDLIVSSQNCQDIFHYHCILKWLRRKNNGIYDCPCCRQIFIEPDISSAS